MSTLTDRIDPYTMGAHEQSVRPFPAAIYSTKRGCADETAAKAHAFLFGFFWLECKNCGRMFSGHEKGGGTLFFAVDGGSTRGWMLCPRCPGERYSADYWDAIHTQAVAA